MSGLKAYLRGMSHGSNESILTWISRMNVIVSGTDVDMQRNAIEDLHTRVDQQWRDKNQPLYGSFRDMLTRAKGVENPWALIQDWAMTEGGRDEIVHHVNSAAPHFGDLDADRPMRGILGAGMSSRHGTRDTESQGFEYAKVSELPGEGYTTEESWGSNGDGIKHVSWGSGSFATTAKSNGTTGKSLNGTPRGKTLVNPDGNKSSAPKDSTTAKKFDGECNYCGMYGHKVARCFHRQKDEGNGLFRNSMDHDIGSAGVCGSAEDNRFKCSRDQQRAHESRSNRGARPQRVCGLSCVMRIRFETCSECIGCDDCTHRQAHCNSEWSCARGTRHRAFGALLRYTGQ